MLCKCAYKRKHTSVKSNGFSNVAFVNYSCVVQSKTELPQLLSNAEKGRINNKCAQYIVLAQATSQWLDRTRTESLGSSLICCPGLGTGCCPLGFFFLMDDAWLRRLSVRPEGSAFADYARVLRLLSGMNQVGLLRALAKARQKKATEDEERRLRSDPSVVQFTKFLENVPVMTSLLYFRLFLRVFFPMAPQVGLLRIVLTLVSPLRLPFLM